MRQRAEMPQNQRNPFIAHTVAILTVSASRTSGAGSRERPPRSTGWAHIPEMEPTMISLKILSAAAAMALVLPFALPSESFAQQGTRRLHGWRWRPAAVAQPSAAVAVGFRGGGAAMRWRRLPRRCSHGRRRSARSAAAAPIRAVAACRTRRRLPRSGRRRLERRVRGPRLCGGGNWGGGYRHHHRRRRFLSGPRSRCPGRRRARQQLRLLWRPAIRQGYYDDGYYDDGSTVAVVPGGDDPASCAQRYRS